MKIIMYTIGLLITLTLSSTAIKVISSTTDKTITQNAVADMSDTTEGHIMADVAVKSSKKFSASWGWIEFLVNLMIFIGFIGLLKREIKNKKIKKEITINE